MERMEAIIARMGILSKDQPLAARPIDLGDLVAQMLAFVDKTLREKRIDVAVARADGAAVDRRATPRSCSRRC